MINNKDYNHKENNKCFTLGIVGAGEIVSKVHLPVLLNMKDISIKWITDIDKIKTRELALAYKIPYIELPSDLTQLPLSDIILLAIPYGSREPYYKAFRQRDSAIYVEKPFSLSIDEHRNLCSWFPPYKICCGYQRRSWGPTSLIQNIIKNKTFGELQAIKFGLGNPAAFTGTAGFFSDIKLAGGGILFDVGVHGIDLMFFCSFAKSFKLNNAKMLLNDDYDIHTNAEFLIKTDLGHSITSEIEVSSIKETTNQLEFKFKDTTIIYSPFDAYGTLKLSSDTKDHQNMVFAKLITSKEMYPLTAFQTFYRHWALFIDGLKNKQTNWTSATDSFLTTELIQQLYENTKNKSLVKSLI